MLTVNWIVTIIIKKFRRGQGAPVFVEGGACATAQWHNGQSKPGLCYSLQMKHSPWYGKYGVWLRRKNFAPEA